MKSLLTNLVPEERRRFLAEEYHIRLSVVVALFGVALTVAAGVLLIPTYVYLSSSAHAKQVRLSTLETSLSSADEAALSARLAALTNDAAALAALQDVPSATMTIRTALAISRPGVTLSGIRYTPPSGNAAGTLSLTGIAATRDALRNYQLALQGAPFAAKADLPVSAYAKDSNIPFSIAITLKP